MSVFRIRFADLVAGPNRVHMEASAAAVGLEPSEWPSLLALDSTVDREGDQLTVRGMVTTRTEEECARCLRRFDSPLVFEFSAFADRSSVTDGEAGGLDEYVLRHDGRSLDLDEVVRDQALLARPMSVLCRPDCAGLCPRCGSDLNLGPCACGTGKAEGSFPSRASS